MATATTATTTRRIGTAGLLPSLTGLRFVAAIMIFTFHAVYQYPFRNQQLTKASTRLVTEAGPMAVGFFFILSGFILTWTAKPELADRTFWRRRFARIYPNHFVTWTAALVLVLIFGPPLTFAGSVPNLLLLHTWVPRGDVMFSMDFVSWSLACEAFFYFSFPMLHRWILKVRPERLWAYLGCAFAAVLVIPLLAQLLPARPLFYDQAVWRIWLVQDFPLSRLLDFVIGMLMARVLLTGRWIGLGLIPAMAVATAAFVGGEFLPHLYGSAAVGISLVLVVAAAARADVEGRFTVFRSPTMVRLGEFTFAFYLVHWLVLNYGHIALGRGRQWSTPDALLIILAGLVVAAALTWLLHILVEIPMERRISGRRRGASETPDLHEVHELLEQEHRAR